MAWAGWLELIDDVLHLAFEAREAAGADAAKKVRIEG
jgi:hypothetical protein